MQIKVLVRTLVVLGCILVPVDGSVSMARAFEKKRLGVRSPRRSGR